MAHMQPEGPPVHAPPPFRSAARRGVRADNFRVEEGNAFRTCCPRSARRSNAVPLRIGQRNYDVLDLSGKLCVFADVASNKVRKVQNSAKLALKDEIC